MARSGTVVGCAGVERANEVGASSGGGINAVGGSKRATVVE